MSHAAAAVQASEGHVDLLHREALQQLIKEESGKRIVPTQEVRAKTGAAPDKWKVAAEAELTSNFTPMGAFHESKEKKICIICRMIAPKTYLHTPHSVLKNAKTRIDQ